MSKYGWPAVMLLLVAALAGCGEAPGGDTGTGAEAAVRAYFGALVQKDWAAAYASATQRRSISLQEIEAIAQSPEQAQAQSGLSFFRQMS